MSNKPLRVFVGVDPRQPLAFTVLASSIYRNSSAPVAITPLSLRQLPITRTGLTEFTFSRYLVPWLCDYEGRAIFLDADILVRGDIAELFTLPPAPLTVATHAQRFEWPAVMVFDCAECRDLTPEYIDDESNKPQTLEWAAQINTLPPEWHYVVGYEEAPENPKLVHFTAGIPEWRETHHFTPDQYVAEWYQEKARTQFTVPWLELMGRSVHADGVLRRYLG